MSGYLNPHGVAGALGNRYPCGMAQRRPAARKPREPWRFVGDAKIDDPRDPYPFAADWGEAVARKDGPPPRDLPPRSLSGHSRTRAQDRQEIRREFKVRHDELWPFGPSVAPDAGLVARIAVNRGTWSTREATELQLQIDPESGRAEWIAIRSPHGLLPSEVGRLPWVNLFAMADAFVRAVGDESTKLDRDHMGKVVMATRDNRRPPKHPKIAKRPGRAGHPDEHYAAVAKRYNELCMRGVTNPTTTIARERGYSRDTVAGWVREARNRGYLPPARRGRAG